MRSFRPFVRVVLFAACLLAAAPAQAAGLFGGPPEPGETPTRFIRFDAWDAGLLLSSTPWVATTIRAVKATCIIDRVRFGVTAGESYLEPDYGAVIAPMLPVQVGYTIWSQPKKTSFFYGAVPDIYAEASIGILDFGFSFHPVVRTSICCDVDYYGIGARLEGGWMTGPARFYAMFQVRLLTFGIGF